MNIIWNKNLYIHSNVKAELSHIIDDLFDKSNANIYCIIKALEGTNLYEILSVVELSNGLYEDKEIEIIGIARGKNNIKDVLIDVVQNTFCLA